MVAKKKKKKCRGQWGTDTGSAGDMSHMYFASTTHMPSSVSAGVRCFLSLWLLVRGNSWRVPPNQMSSLNCECLRRSVTSATLGQRPYIHSKVQSCFSLFCKTSPHWGQTELANCYATVVLSAHSRTQSQVTMQRLYGPARTTQWNMDLAMWIGTVGLLCNE